MNKIGLIFLLSWMVICAGKAQQIVRAEYFFGDDPGIGNGTSIAITTAGDAVTQDLSVSTESLSVGYHTLSIRSQDDLNRWSIAQRRAFYLYDPTFNDLSVGQPEITAAEYFFDSDPGVGNGTTFTILTPGNEVIQNLSFPTAALVAGYHTLWIRTQDVSQRWSIAERQLFYLYDTEATNLVVDQPQIVAVEYFVDADPGFGGGTAIDITAADEIVQSFEFEVDTYSEGTHQMFVRSKDADDRWSATIMSEFTVTSATEANNITDFTFSEEASTAVINNSQHTIQIEAVEGTSRTAITPTISLSTGAEVSPLTGVAQDFTDPVIYTVTGENGTSTQDWEVSLSVIGEISIRTEVKSFSLVGQTSEASITDMEIAIEIATGASLNGLSPQITIADKATISPQSGATLDFTDPVTYTVTAEDGTTSKDWVVTVSATGTFTLNSDSLALLSLYQATDGSRWANPWDLNQEMSTWFGVSISSERVTGLDLTYNNLIGEVPAEVGNMTNLTTLLLSNNELTAIPYEIGNLSSLITLELGLNQLSEIPTSIGNLAGLTKLSLNSNLLTSIPAEIGGLTNLITLELHRNDLVAIPLELGDLANLSTLLLSANQITSIPTHIGDLTTLTVFQLHSNKLTSIPNNFTELSNLTHLSLYSNQLINLPDLTALPFDATNGLRVEDNKIGFTDIITNLQLITDGKKFIYAPQTIEEIVRTELVIGTSYELFTSETTSGTSYQWYFDDIAISGAISASHSLTFATESIGTYHCEMANTSVSGLTIKRAPYELFAQSPTSIVGFTMSEETTDAIIADGSVSIELVNGTIITSLVPNITLVGGATVTPASGVEQDFTEVVTYTVTSEDGTTTQDWLVSVTVTTGLSIENAITNFEILGEFGIIGENIVTIELPSKTDFGSLTPTITLSSGATVNPLSGVEQNFSSPVTYTVTAEDGATTQDWVVTAVPLKDLDTDSLALLALYNSTDGENWTTPWDLNQPISTWNGVTATNNRVSH